MDVNKTLQELKARPGFADNVGMMLVHNEFVRAWSRADHAPSDIGAGFARHGQNGSHLPRNGKTARHFCHCCTEQKKGCSNLVMTCCFWLWLATYASMSKPLLQNCSTASRPRRSSNRNFTKNKSARSLFLIGRCIKRHAPACLFHHAIITCYRRTYQKNNKGSPA